jgi:N-hydroxyarylamine O-acetyltransferase
MAADEWNIDRLDVGGYLGALGVEAREPTPAALAELHEAHVRTFTFANIDVLLEQHPGVELDAVQEKFLGRGRGGYCFEHVSIFSAALERLGYRVRRGLGRVRSQQTGALGGRTHMVAEVTLDDERWLCDPGFGMSLLRPIRMADGTEDDYLPGWRYRMRHTDAGEWELLRRRDQGWELTHTTDPLAVKPVDVAMGNHFTSTYPASHFRAGLMLAKHLPGRHVTLTHQALTIRTPGAATEHRPLRPGELEQWLDELEVNLTGDERSRLLGWVEAANRRS